MNYLDPEDNLKVNIVWHTLIESLPIVEWTFYDQNDHQYAEASCDQFHIRYVLYRNDRGECLPWYTFIKCDSSYWTQGSDFTKTLAEFYEFKAKYEQSMSSMVVKLQSRDYS